MNHTEQHTTGSTPARTRRTRRPFWMTATALAATVAAAGGALAVAASDAGAARAASAPRTASPAVPSRAAAPAPRGPAAAAPTTLASARPASGTSAAATPAPGSRPRTPIGPASLVVPSGWTVEERTTDADGSGPIGRVWCLDRAKRDDCTIRVELMDHERNALNSDVEGGYESNPMYCDPQAGHTRELVEGRVQQVGGRDGEFRRWHWSCADGSGHDIAQYTVPTASAWTVWSEEATPAVRRTMAEVVGSLRLPAATAPLPLYVRGVLGGSLSAAPDGYEIEVDRAIAGAQDVDHDLTSFFVPRNAAFTTADGSPVDWPVLSGTVVLHTDGHIVTDGRSVPSS